MDIPLDQSLLLKNTYKACHSRKVLIEVNGQMYPFSKYFIDFQNTFVKDTINPYNCLLKNANFSIKTSNA